MAQNDAHDKRGRRIALVIAGVAVSWLIVTTAGAAMGWGPRALAFFDLAALAGFGVALWMVYGLWRDSRGDGNG
ncbi:DUF5337 family protein [Cognatishimia sp. F0-27]|uniref:DUF5337 family protein n=1 Tax=Cognatishimia sp. F0-27 TaxID=2816855 RepID=UPI001D0C0290|nr:DUF5337 family protein [Cognatishimia sp. F0-27]MCC1492307.1 DUF5337 domain-containing protein [Cognatishimia sp. F0-27]